MKLIQYLENMDVFNHRIRLGVVAASTELRAGGKLRLGVVAASTELRAGGKLPNSH
jgi:hypothetical protein